jgi:hypothetical protein
VSALAADALSSYGRCLEYFVFACKGLPGFLGLAVHPLTPVPAALLSPTLPHPLRLQLAKKSTTKQQERKAPLAGFEIGFTPDNEEFISRLSMLGFGSAVVGEFLTGQGVLGQLGYELGLQQVRWGGCLVLVWCWSGAGSVLLQCENATCGWCQALDSLSWRGCGGQRRIRVQFCCWLLGMVW